MTLFFFLGFFLTERYEAFLYHIYEQNKYKNSYYR